MRVIRAMILIGTLLFGLATCAQAGDLKLGGEMYLNTYHSSNSDAANMDYAGWFTLKLSQDVNDLTSWGVALKFDYPYNFKTDSSDSVKFNDAFIKLTFNPSVNLRIGRFETRYDQSQKYFAGEWDNNKEFFKDSSGASQPPIWALTSWKDLWRERNVFGVEMNEKMGENLSLMETYFIPERYDGNNKDVANVNNHYGFKVNYKIGGFTLTGAFFSNKDQNNGNVESILGQVTYTKDAFSVYALLDRMDTDPEETNVNALGAAYTLKSCAFYIERYQSSGAMDDQETKYGFEYYPGKNIGLYINLLQLDHYDAVVRSGITVNF